MVEAIVEHDYVAKELDELTIKKGDVIKDVVKKQPGWCEGTLKDRKGLFPDNFVKLINKDVTYRNKRDVNRIRKCRVVFSYTKDHEDELNLNVDDIIEIIGEEEEGWWRGTLHGKTGVFPSNFVEEIHAPNSKCNSIEDLTYESEHKIPSLPPKPTKILCEVKYPYKPDNDDELCLREGDIITLISKDGQDAGWWRGELNGKIGVFPDNFVVIIEEKPPKEEKKIVQVPKTSYIASQRKSFEPKHEQTKPEKELFCHESHVSPPTVHEQIKPEKETRVTPPAVPGKKPSLPLKKSPSGSGPGGGLFSGLRKKLVDVVDGASVSKTNKIQEIKTDSKSDENHDAFDQVERNSLLLDVRATRAKAPGRRPPSVILKEGEPPTVINGNSDYGSLEENLTSSTTSIEQETEVKPKVREWEKHKAPWLEEMKQNQAKRTSTSPGPETRNKLTTPDKLEEKETSPIIDMSKSMPSFSTKILKTPPNELEKNINLRPKPTLPTSRPQSIESVKPTKISPIVQNKTPSPNQKPQLIEKPTENSKNEFVSMKLYTELLERLQKLENLVEKKDLEHKLAIDDLRGKLQVETDMRMLLQAELAKVEQCAMHV